jgi:hypothetical protein
MSSKLLCSILSFWYHDILCANTADAARTGLMLICIICANQFVGVKEDLLPESLIPSTPTLAIETRALTRRLLELYLISVPVLINSDVHKQAHMFQMSQLEWIF